MTAIDVSSLLAYLTCLSAATQKATEVVKTYLPMDKFSDKVKKSVIMTISAVSSGTAVVLVPPEGVTVLTALPIQYLFVIGALLGSSGSGLWHDAQTIVTTFKEQMQTKK